MKINLKKVLSMMLVLAFIFSLAACAGEPAGSSSTAPASTGGTESTGADSSA